MTEARNKLHALMDEGMISGETLAAMLINWMSEDEAQDFCDRGDVSEYFEEEEEEDEEEVEGTQYRYIVHNDDPEDFSASVHKIDSDGDDEEFTKFKVDTALYNEHPEIDWTDPEDATDFFLKRDGLPFANHYLDEYDEVVMS